MIPNAVTPTAAYKLSVKEIHSAIRQGELTVTELVESLFERYDKRNEDIRAWAQPLDRDRIMREAAALDALPEDKRGALHGIPCGVKDVINTQDLPTAFNSPAYAEHSPGLDAPIVFLFRFHGAIIFGKTTTTQFAATADGPGTRNPHDTRRTPGGSSSGSAAAVADFQIPLAIGTQTGGSVVRPAAFNGISALKPTYGIISTEGVKHFAESFDTVGLFARGADDLSFVFNALDLATSPLALHLDENRPFANLKVGICRTMMWDHTGEGTRNALARAESLLRGAGAAIEHIQLPDKFKELDQDFDTVLAVEARTSFKHEYVANYEHLAPSLRELCENTAGYTDKDGRLALDRIAALRSTMDSILSSYSVVLTPSVPDVAPKGDATGSYQLCKWWSALHGPVVNIAGFVNKESLPIGISAVAPRGEDITLLHIAGRLEDLFTADNPATIIDC